MSPIQIFTPEKVIVQNALRSLRDSRKLIQNFLYLTKGAPSFHLYRDEDLKGMHADRECAFLEKNGSLRKPHSPAFISLGCGNAAPDLVLLRQMRSCGIGAAYFGIDSSRSMLKLAEKNFKTAKMNPTLILGDFTMPDFKGRFAPLLEGVDRSLYAMMGGTFGNVDQGELAGVLSGLLEPDDLLYIDVVPLEKGRALERLKIRFAKLPENYERFFSQALERMSVPPGTGRFEGEEDMESSPRAYRQTFYFRAGRSFTVSAAGHRIPFESGERMELLTIRAYDICSLQDFFETCGFRFLGTYVSHSGFPGHHRWQRILLEKRGS